MITDLSEMKEKNSSIVNIKEQKATLKKEHRKELRKEQKKEQKKGRGVRHSITLPRVIYLIILIGAMVLVSNRGGAFSYVLFFSVLMYPIISLAGIIYTRMTLRISQDVPDRLLYKNTAVPYTLVLENSGIFPAGLIRLMDAVEIEDFRKDITSSCYSLLPGEKKKRETELSIRYAGSYSIGMVKLQISDCFGIIKMTYDVAAPLRVHVLPAVSDIAVNDINNHFSALVRTVNAFRTDRDEDYSGNDLRKYIPGEPINRVHWKNYARTGEMYVRLPEKQDSEMMNFALVTSLKELPPAEKDFFLEYITSAASWFAERRKPVQFIYYSSGIKKFIVDSYDSFQTFYTEKLSGLGMAYGEEDEEALIRAAGEQGGDLIILREDSSKE